jgi:hypothetical protein
LAKITLRGVSGVEGKSGLFDALTDHVARLSLQRIHARTCWIGNAFNAGISRDFAVAERCRLGAASPSQRPFIFLLLAITQKSRAF